MAFLLEREWSEPERWVWEEICARRIANFSDRFGALDPNVRAGWGAKRLLRAGFIKALLLDKALLEQIPATGVRIVGAHLRESIDLEYGDLPALWLDNCRFVGGLSVRGCVINGLFSLDGSAFCSPGHDVLLYLEAKEIMLDGCNFAGAVTLEHSVFVDEVNISNATCGGDLNLNGVCAEAITVVNSHCRTLSARRSSVKTSFILNGSRFDGDVDLVGLEAGGDVQLSSVFGGYLNMSVAVVGCNLHLIDATVAGELSIVETDVGRHFYMFSSNSPHASNGTGARFMKEVHLERTKVSRDFNCRRAYFEAEVEMRGIEVGGGFNCKEACFSEGCGMTSAEISGPVSFDSALAKRPLRMQGLRAGQSVSLVGVRCEKALNLSDARIADSLLLRHASISGMLLMTGLSVGGDIKASGTLHTYAYLDDLEVEGSLDLQLITHDYLKARGLRVRQDVRLGGTYGGRVELHNSRIGGDLDLSGASLQSVDASACTIGGSLWLVKGLNSTSWQDGASFDLRDAGAAALQDWTDPKIGSRSAWPSKGNLSLSGFTCGRLGGVGSRAALVAFTRPAAWYVEWLGRDPAYSPQPYEHLANLLRAMGDPRAADRVLFAGRERARKLAWETEDRLRWFGLGILKWTIGYGIGLRFFTALIWVFLLTGLGVVVIWYTGGSKASVQLPDITAYSLDQLLPIVDIAEKPQGLSLSRVAERYMFIHRILGFLLSSFIAAGVAGLTQRPRG